MLRAARLSHSADFGSQAMNGVPLVALACGETWTACFLSDEEVQLFGELDYGSRKLCGENALVLTNTRQDTSPSESFKPL